MEVRDIIAKGRPSASVAHLPEFRYIWGVHDGYDYALEEFENNRLKACANERNQWHNVSDELPPRIKETVNISKAVMVSNGLSYGTGYYNYNLNKWFCVGTTNITHWMELPELPKKE